VGIVDDGAKVVDLKGIQKGKSFRADNVDYCVGLCEHGTEMALCVQEICPLAELYIARFDDSRKIEDQKFTISSCIEVRVAFAGAECSNTRLTGSRLLNGHESWM
jgi:hypothetical protein